MKRICVFLGSSPGARPDFRAAARGLARELVARGLELVYGGANVGLMGVLADEVMALGGRVIGVIPESLVAKELAHRGITELRVVDSMHQRKAEMEALAGGFVALPGGLGTLDETFEILTWAQLGMHRKPCGFLNVAGFYDPLLAFLDHAEAERLIKPEHRAMPLVATDPAALLDAFARYAPPATAKWIDRDQS